MTIERLAEFYVKGVYSKLDFYSWLLSILDHTEDTEYVMERVPAIALDVVFDMAQRHYESAGKASSFEEQKNPEKILRWRDRRSELLAAARENGAGEAATAHALPDRPADRSGADRDER